MTPRGGWTWVVAGGLAAWLVVSAASQHPLRIFDRLRTLEPTGLAVPDWRFFAPEPAQHDFHILHRVLTAAGEQAEWRETTSIAARSWRHVVWHPHRRREKAVFDVCSELLAAAAQPEVDLTRTSAYQLMAGLVRQVVRQEHAGGPPPRGFQFAIARHSGHLTGAEPEYLLASPLVPVEPGGWAEGATDR